MIDLEKLERELRAEFAAEPPATGEINSCAQRTNEVEIQWALWLAAEKNLGSSPATCAAAFGSVTASCLRNLVRDFDAPAQSGMAQVFFSALTHVFNEGVSVGSSGPKH